MKLIDIIGVKKADPNEAKADEEEINLDRAINGPSKANAIGEAWRRPVSRCSELLGKWIVADLGNLHQFCRPSVGASLSIWGTGLVCNIGAGSGS